MTKLVIFYEDRKEFIEQYNKRYDNHALAEKLSEFLLNKSDILNFFNKLKHELGSGNAILLESKDIMQFNKTISSESNIIIWNITDGIDLYKGSYIPSYAKLLDLSFFGSSTYSQTIAQSKYKFIQKCQTLSIPTPSSCLFEKQQVNKKINNLQKHNMYFVKLNDFDNNIGILEKSKCHSFEEAKNIAEKLYLEYEHPVLIQEYIDGDDVRVCFLDIDDSKKPIYLREHDIDNMLGIYYINKSKEGNNVDYVHENTGSYNVSMIEVKDNNIISHIKESIKKIIIDLKIKDYFAVDFRVCKKTLNVYAIEINTAPFISSERFKFYVNDFYNLSLEKAISKSLRKYLV